MRDRAGVCSARQSDLAVLQVGVDVLDEGVIWVSDREYQLAERAAPHVALLGLHPELHTHTHTQEHTHQDQPVTLCDER